MRMDLEYLVVFFGGMGGEKERGKEGKRERGKEVSGRRSEGGSFLYDINNIWLFCTRDAIRYMFMVWKVK
jgi:hypothetical protein